MGSNASRQQKLTNLCFIYGIIHGRGRRALYQHEQQGVFALKDIVCRGARLPTYVHIPVLSMSCCSTLHASMSMYQYVPPPPPAV